MAEKQNPETQFEKIKQEIASLGFLLPGSINEVYNTCGTPGCRCKDPDNPKKHGPYYYWTRKCDGKTVTRIIPKDKLSSFRTYNDNYKKLKELVKQMENVSLDWIEIS